MGNECSQEEREFRYCTFHDALITIDNDIKKEMKNTNISTKKYIPYGLLSKNICKKYPFLINKKNQYNFLLFLLIRYIELYI